MAGQLVVDLYECAVDVVDDMDKVREIAHRMVAEIGAEIVKECFHKFEPVGITYIAVITTSHFSIHTWPEYQYAAVDIFSCDEKVPDMVTDKLQAAFGAKRVVTRRFERDIEGSVKG